MKGIGLLAGGILLFASTAAESAEMKWAKSMNAAMSAARAGNKLVMADFYTDW